MNTGGDISDVRIVKYNPSDLDRIMEIELASFTAPWSRESYEELAPLDTINIWVAKIGDEVVGYMLFQYIAEDMELHTIAVDALHRRKGIARRLIGHMVEKAREYGVKRIFLQVRPTNVAARNLYGSFGFAPVGIRKAYYHDNGEDAMVLKMEVS